MTPLVLGQGLQVMVSSFGRKISCVSTVLSLKPLRISPPRRKGVIVPPGERIQLWVWEQDEVYEATAVVLSFDQEGVRLELPQWSKLQRRKSPRWKTDMPCWVEELAGKLVDLSPDGCAVLLPAQVLPGMEVRVRLDLPEKGLVRLTGTVKRCQAEGRGFRAGIEFRALSPGLKYKLRWIFLRFNAEWSKETLWNTH